MHRQFSSNGGEREVSRWLKDLGYRGPGLRRETLISLCRGEYSEIWDTLMQNCRSESTILQIRKALNTKIRHQASKETHQRSQEEKLRCHELRKSVEALTVQCRNCDTDVEILQLEVQRLRDELLKQDAMHSRHRQLLQSKYEKAKILQASTSKTQEATNKLTKDIETLQKQLFLLKKFLVDSGPITEKRKIDLAVVLHLMYEFTQHHVSERIRSRRPGEIFSPEGILPKLDGCLKDEPKLKQLYHGIGQLYTHHRNFLIRLFAEANEEAWIKARQYEMKYNKNAPRITMPPLEEIEELQAKHISNFFTETQMEIALRKQKTEVKLSLKSIENLENATFIKLLMEVHSLRKELGALKQEVVQFRSAESVGKGSEVKEIYGKLVGQMEHSKQMDVLFLFFLKEFKEMQKAFCKSKAEIRSKWRQHLVPVVMDCSQQLNQCEQAIASEYQKFLPVKLYGRVKYISLTKKPDGVTTSNQIPSLQRFSLARLSVAKPHIQGYSISTLSQVFSELRHSLPCLVTQSPESLFDYLSQAIDSSLTNSQMHEVILQALQTIEKETKYIGSSTENLISKDNQRCQWVEQTVDQIDKNMKEGHEALYALQKKVREAFESFRDYSAFYSLPWYYNNGKNATEWISQFKSKQSVTKNNNM